MNENGIIDAVTGGKPIDFNVILETKSLMILAGLLFLTGAAIIMFYKVTKEAE